MIMHVITDFAATEGAQVMLARLAREWREEPTLVVPLRSVSERNRDLVAGSNVSFVPLGATSAAGLAGSIGRLAAIIRRERPAVILCWMYHAMIAGLLAARMSGTGVPVYWTIRQSLDDPSALTRSTRLAMGVARRLSGLSQGIIYNSARAMTLHGDVGYSARNATMIPNGFDLPALGETPQRTPRVFGIAGRLHAQKDHGTFFRAAAEVARTHPCARFVAAGRGLTPDSEAVGALLDASGLSPDRIDLRGEVSDMASFYGEIDALVLSSRTEGFPNVVAEAMSYGKPVIATDVGDAGAVVGDTGFVVPPGDSAAMSGAMRTVLDLEPERYGALAHHARRRVDEHYSLPAVAQRYRAFLALP